MSSSDSHRIETALHASASKAATAVELMPPETSRGSRRKRLWELEPHAHCPLLGVCLPIEALRKIVGKAMGGQVVADDYELHAGAVGDSRYRSAVADALQRDLDRRYALALKRSSKLKSVEALAAWWDESLQEQDIAGPLWAIITHAHCTEDLAHRIEGQVHMLQHQVGVASRVERERLAGVINENAVIARELGRAQQRCQRMADDHARLADSLHATILQLRGHLLVKESLIASLQSDLQQLQAASPALKSRLELAQELERLTGSRQEVQRAFNQARQESERLRFEVAELRTANERRDAAAKMASKAAQPSVATLDENPPVLNEQAVLCVGGRPASVPIYRQVIEDTGGCFLHHDGGDEDSAAKLDATLAAADLVICQTGCISHDAYWRVKDHCKRTGKRCVFVESPSRASLKRALSTLVLLVSDPAKEH